MKKEYKVWFRQIYCTTFTQWLQEMFWCFVVIKIFPKAVNLNYPTENTEGKKLCPYCYEVISSDYGEIKE